MRFQILGPIRVCGPEQEVRITAGRERTLLAMLLLSANQAVPSAQLTEAIWAGRPPGNARDQLQGCVHRLRTRLASAGIDRMTIVTDPAGYRAVVDPEELDLLCFRRLVTEARTAAAGGRIEQARDGYLAALGLWRGSALADVDSPRIRQAAAALDEEHAQALEARFEVELALGGAGELIAELTDLVGQHPYREKLHRALMLSLYRAGRQADALSAYRRTHKIMYDELGTEPGPELQRLHQAILNRDLALDQPQEQHAAGSTEGTTATPRELPADVAGFTGRADQLRELDDLLPNDTAVEPALLVVSAIAGTAGVGKTALAVRWAHRVTDRFPDGELFLNLRGYAAQSPLRPIEALATLLRSLGTPAEQIPVDEDAAAALYRTQLADRRMLIVLDNAGSAAQVRPLLPGSPGSVVVVTSREGLSGLIAHNGAHRLTLDVLSPQEAQALLHELLGEERARAEPAAIAELARTCAYLPLAIRIAAANLADYPHRTVADYARELATGDQLVALRNVGDESGAVQTAFDLSYRAMPLDAQRIFRLLGLVPGPDVTPAAAAALAGTDVEEAARLLNRLARAHLMDEHAPGRYTFHDLLRAYAQDCAQYESSELERREALDRLMTWHMSAADAAATILYPDTLRLPVPVLDVDLPRAEFAGTADALAWLNSERANLVAAARHSADVTTHPAAWHVNESLRSYFWGSGYTADWLTVAASALAAAKQADNPRAQAAAQLTLGDVHVALSRYSLALDHYGAALTLARKINWADAEKTYLGRVGAAYLITGDATEAIEYLSQRLALERSFDPTSPGAAAALGNVGNAYSDLGRLRMASDYQERALSLYRQLGSTRGEAAALSNLGSVAHRLGRLGDALDHLTRSRSLLHEAGIGSWEATTLFTLAGVHLELGRGADALDVVTKAKSLVGETVDAPVRAMADTVLGSVYLHLGRVADGFACYQQGYATARSTGIRWYEAVALIGLAAACSESGDSRAAHARAEEALTQARAYGYRMLEGQALTVLAEAHLRDGDHQQAKAYAGEALKSHRETEHRLGEARTLVVLGHILTATGDPDAAREQWQAALDTYTETGAAPPAGLPQWLAESQSRPNPTETSSGTESS